MCNCNDCNLGESVAVPVAPLTEAFHQAARRRIGRDAGKNVKRRFWTVGESAEDSRDCCRSQGCWALWRACHWDSRRQPAITSRRFVRPENARLQQKRGEVYGNLVTTVPWPGASSLLVSTALSTVTGSTPSRARSISTWSDHS